MKQILIFVYHFATWFSKISKIISQLIFWLYWWKLHIRMNAKYMHFHFGSQWNMLKLSLAGFDTVYSISLILTNSNKDFTLYMTDFNPNHAKHNGIQQKDVVLLLIDLVALSRPHTWTTDGCCCIEQGCLASYWRGLGQIHTWTTDGCCCIEQGV